MIEVGDIVRTRGRSPKTGVVRLVFTTNEKTPRRRAFVFFEGPKRIGEAVYDRYEQPWDLDDLERVEMEQGTLW